MDGENSYTAPSTEECGGDRRSIMIGKLSATLAGGAVALGAYRARQPKPPVTAAAPDGPLQSPCWASVPCTP